MPAVQRREVLLVFSNRANVSSLQGRSFSEAVHRTGDEQVMYL